MGVNSIRASLSKEDIISEIRLSLSAVPEIHVVVEGDDDIKLISSFLGKSVNIYESFSGKHGVIEIIEYFHGKYQVIGICDRDYDECSVDQLFFYDRCCAEAMMVGSDRAFTKLCNEYPRCSYIPSDLISLILTRLKFISLLRMYNSKNCWGLNFKGLKIPVVFSPFDNSDASEFILRELDRINSGSATPIYLAVKTQIESEECSTSDDLLNIVNGHDLVALLSVYFSVHHNGDAGPKNISGHLRCAYSFEDFKMTALFSSLTRFSGEHRLNMLQG